MSLGWRPEHTHLSPAAVSHSVHSSSQQLPPPGEQGGREGGKGRREGGGGIEI